MRCRRCGSTEVVLFKDRHRCSVCDSTDIKGAGTQNQQSVSPETKTKVPRVGLVGKIVASLLTAGFFLLYFKLVWRNTNGKPSVFYGWSNYGWSSCWSNSSSKKIKRLIL